MGSGDVSTTGLEKIGTGLHLRFEPKPLNAPLWIAGLVVLGCAGLVALWLRDPQMSATFVIVAAVLALLILGFSFLLLRDAGIIRIATLFDIENRLVIIATERRGKRLTEARHGFDQVSELRVLQQRAKGSQLETLSLGVKDQGFIRLAEERRHRPYSAEPFGTPLKDMADQIAADTGLPRGKAPASTIAKAGKWLGMGRS